MQNSKLVRDQWGPILLCTVGLMMSMTVHLWGGAPGSTKSKVCRRSLSARMEVEGHLAEYLKGVTEQWLLIAPDANPAMLEIFRDRDRQPLRPLEPWAGEFAGKYLTGATQVFRVTRDERLRRFLEQFVTELCALQDGDGYLGPWPRDARLTGNAPNVGPGKPGPTWDAWGHYHVMVGLLVWHEESGDVRALGTARKIGDLLCRKFLGKKSPRLVDTGSTEMNLAPAHSLGILARVTGEREYLQLGEQIIQEFAAKDKAGNSLAGDYLEAAVAGREFFQSPKPRWESLHPILGLAELYYLTGNPRYRAPFEHWWWSIVKLDRHNNGGFSSGEQAQGNPYHPGAIETCCTIAWMAYSVEMLQLTGNSLVADELELSTLNSVLGMHSTTGRWATYNTPMDGIRKASAHDIVFQSRAGSPELNCCSVNSARGFGLLSEWALLQDEKGLYLNWYGPGKFLTTGSDGKTWTCQIGGNYPFAGDVQISIQTDDPQNRRLLRLRIPAWSETSTVQVNGVPIPDSQIKPGEYLHIDRAWCSGDTIQVHFDMTPHFWVGEWECAGKVSLYRGPLLLTYDRRFNDMDPTQLPALDARKLNERVISWSGRRKPGILVEYPGKDGRKLRLCDFASAGDAGSPYLSWITVDGVRPTTFTREHPLPTGRQLQP